MAIRDLPKTVLERWGVPIASAFLLAAWMDIGLVQFTNQRLPVFPFAALSVPFVLASGIRNTSPRQQPVGKMPRAGRVVAGLGLTTCLFLGYGLWAHTAWANANAAGFLILAATSILDFAGSAGTCDTSQCEGGFPIAD